ncbi:putative PHD finger protein rhinoceros [Blattamonas nauphoetae]|uniref:PHD finger protein rhinoceros n=1 Tax=Blattamonas nauphoetae TaxID=2049346 RepID=A0ABQ9XCM3_9EUKA|nr:putative PHD finger protein rhinoceros [Blattamonas nauphoetae]
MEEKPETNEKPTIAEEGHLEPQSDNAYLDFLDDELPENEHYCTVCGSQDSDEDDPIVYCDGCQTAVHASCYGITADDLKKDKWYCQPCRKSVPPRLFDGNPNPLRKCLICGHFGGALTEVTGRPEWVHTCCCLNLTEITFTATTANMSTISKRRFQQNCDYCRVKDGGTMVCSYLHCRKAFHPFCAIKNHFHVLHLPNPSITPKASPYLTLFFCPEHSLEIRDSDPKDQYTFYEHRDFKLFVRTPKIEDETIINPDEPAVVDVSKESTDNLEDYTFPLVKKPKKKGRKVDRDKTNYLKRYPYAIAVIDIEAMKESLIDDSPEPPTLPSGAVYDDIRSALIECSKANRPRATRKSQMASVDDFLIGDDIDNHLGIDQLAEEEEKKINEEVLGRDARRKKREEKKHDEDYTERVYSSSIWKDRDTDADDNADSEEKVAKSKRPTHQYTPITTPAKRAPPMFFNTPRNPLDPNLFLSHPSPNSHPHNYVPAFSPGQYGYQPVRGMDATTMRFPSIPSGPPPAQDPNASPYGRSTLMGTSFPNFMESRPNLNSSSNLSNGSGFGG